MPGSASSPHWRGMAGSDQLALGLSNRGGIGDGDPEPEVLAGAGRTIFFFFLGGIWTVGC